MLSQMSPSSIGSRCSSEAFWTNPWATRAASRIVFRSPERSIEKPSTGLPDARMPSAKRSVQLGSMPITMTAAMLGLVAVPISVRKCSSRSSPNCKRP